MIGKLICWLLRRHIWRKARMATWKNNDVRLGVPDRQVWAKQCARCGAVREVKQRKPNVTVPA